MFTLVLHITRDLPHQHLFVGQQHFTKTLLVKYGFHNVSTVSTPGDPHLHLASPHADDRDPNFLIMKSLALSSYLETHSQCDIAQVVSTTAQYATTSRKSTTL